MWSELTDWNIDSWPCLCICVESYSGCRDKGTVPEVPILEMQPPRGMNLLLSPQSGAVTHKEGRSFPNASSLGQRVGVEHSLTDHHQICALLCFLFFPWESAHFALRFAQSKTAPVSNGNPAGSSQDVLFPLYSLLTWERGPRT